MKWADHVDGVVLDVALHRVAPREGRVAPREACWRRWVVKPETMNDHERRAWRLLLQLGARKTMIVGKHAIDISPIRITNLNNLRLFVGALLEVAGRSGCNRRHQDRTGTLVYIVTDEREDPYMNRAGGGGS